jgi:hypothetical protein
VKAADFSYIPFAIYHTAGIIFLKTVSLSSNVHMFLKSVQSWPSFETKLLFTFPTIVPNESCLSQMISYYWEYLSWYTAPTVSEMVQLNYIPGSYTPASASGVSHSVLSDLSEVHGGLRGTGPVSSPSFFGFPRNMLFLNTHLLSPGEAWNDCDIIILYHILGLQVIVNLTFDLSQKKT